MSARAIAPRVVVFSGASPPAAEPGFVYLRQLPSSPDDGFVFGDGSHPTTRLCAGALELLVRLKRPKAVLDVGTGSGVLARIARARGAAFVVGTDIDPAALSCAKRHCALDDTAVEIELSAALPDSWGPRFELAVANILEAPLTELAPSLARCLGPRGSLLLSGFTPLQVPPLREAFERQRLRYVQEARLDEWSLLHFERP